MIDGPSSDLVVFPSDKSEKTARHRVLVLTRSDISTRIETSLPDACTAVTASCPDDLRSDFETTDLFVVDETVLQRHRDAIDAAAAEPQSSPVLLVTDSDPDPEVWDVVDDVVAADATERTIHARVDNLLERRKRVLEAAGGDTSRSIVERANSCVVEAAIDDEALVVTWVDPQFEHVFGYDGESIEGSSLCDLVVPDEECRRAAELVETIRQGITVEETVRRDTKWGRRTFRLCMVPVAGSDGPDVYVMYTDVTEQRCRRQQIQVLNRVLRHNLRNELNVVLGNADVVIDAVDSPRAEHAARSIRRAARDLVELGETASSLQTTLEPACDDVIDAVAAVDRVRSDFDRRDPDCTIRLDAPGRTFVAADARLKTALSELCENALQHTRTDGKDVCITVTPGEEWTEISVADSGPGLPPSDQAVLLGDDETPLKHGSGLGLWIVNWIVTALGGDLTVEDREPTGTVVTISLRSADQ